MRVAAIFSAAILAVSCSSNLHAERPGPIEVREAVERSKAEYKALHPTVTRKQAAKQVEEDAQRARSKLAEARRIRNPKQRAALLKEANDELAALVSEADAIVKDYKPEDRNRLMPLQLGSVSVGTVGRLTEKHQSADGIGDEHRFIRCLKALDKTEMLAVLEHREPAASGESSGEPQPVQSSQFILKGIPVSVKSENQLIPGVFDVVVTGQQDYAESEDASPRTLYVLEVFNPDQPFR